MARFFVGCKVRIVRSVYADRVGRTARIWKIQYHPNHAQHGAGTYCYLDLDGMGRIHADTGREIAFRPEDIEPILGSGNVAGEEGTCEPLDKLLSEVLDHEAVK